MPEKQTVQLFHTRAVLTCRVQSYDFWGAGLESQVIYIYNRIKATEVLGKFCFPLHLYTSIIANAFPADVHRFTDRNRDSNANPCISRWSSLVKMNQSIDFSSLFIILICSLIPHRRSFSSEQKLIDWNKNNQIMITKNNNKCIFPSLY